MSGRAIPNFFLYSEAPRATDPSFVHVEPLDARSRPMAWRIEPHMHAALGHVFLIEAGGGAMSADDALFPFAAPAVLVVPAHVVHGFAWQPETAESVLTLSMAIIGRLGERERGLTALFDDPAYFSRLFRRTTGQPPRAFRSDHVRP